MLIVYFATVSHQPRDDREAPLVRDPRVNRRPMSSEPTIDPRRKREGGRGRDGNRYNAPYSSESYRGPDSGRGLSETETMIEEQNKLIYEAEAQLASGNLNARKVQMVKEQIEHLRKIRQEAIEKLERERASGANGRVNEERTLRNDDLNGEKESQEPQADVSALLDQLVASGLLQQSNSMSPEKKTKGREAGVKQVNKRMPNVVLGQTDLKKRYDAVIESLYGDLSQQCANCGLRFGEEAKAAYADHLDWHFRQNRKEKEKLKRASSRKWYMSEKDWLEYKEVEDKNEKAPSFFDTISSDEEEEKEEVSCPVTLSNGIEAANECGICGDPFTKFWNDKAEDWHFKEAIRVGDETFHYHCYQDSEEVNCLYTCYFVFTW